MDAYAKAKIDYLIISGEKMEAIKVHRKFEDSGLVDARNYVERRALDIINTSLIVVGGTVNINVPSTYVTFRS